MPTAGRLRPLSTKLERSVSSIFPLLTLLANLVLLLQHVANLIGADAKSIIFTSGATESNNLAVKGTAKFYSETKKHIITTQTVRPAPLFT